MKKFFAALAVLMAGSAQAVPKLWQCEGTVMADFRAAEPQKSLAKAADSKGKWRLVEYETTRYSGTMLYSANGVKPETVTVNPQLKGWHRIYAATFSSSRGRLTLQVQGDPAAELIMQGKVGGWGVNEKGEEVFWKCADLTGKTISVGKPNPNSPIGLMWLRFEPMTDAEVAEMKLEFSNRSDKRLHAHSDMEWTRNIYGENLTAEEGGSFIEACAQADVDLVSVEMPGGMPTGKVRERYEDCVRRANKYGLKLCLARRMSNSVPVFPWVGASQFVTDHPEWWCRDRDGEPVSTMSYAFPDVGEHGIDPYIERLDLGFHGVSPILHRGIQILFEKPVIARFKARYPGVDPHVLSLDDDRLAGVRCEIFEENFMRRLRTRLDEYSKSHGLPRLLINPILPCSVADCRRQGLDVESWARKGLIDSAIFCNMRVWEDEDRFKDEKTGLISLEKYAACKRKGDVCPIRREYVNLVDKMVAGGTVAANAKIERETKVKFYYDICIEGMLQPEEIISYAEKFYDAGAEHLSMWDCFASRVANRSEWFVSSRLGHGKELKKMPRENTAYRRVFRVLKLNGVSLASYNPNWCG